ncbi:hypothetical protein [Marilutibacter alkalisoli]|uniref:hypothetical protein n=1 Tax=Marilutibacter alkalisoli TaxID=2591633 RepID=UPI001ABDED10|nr:hypothetical protein [Lysobacter alkalisoli]
MESQESQRIAIVLARRAETAGQIADTMVSTWQAIDAALSPIIGQRGVAVLYKRSLYLAGHAHPWLAGMHEDSQATMDLMALRSVFAQQSSTDAAVAGGAFLQTFHELLSSLIGLSLTERLLRPVWAPFSSGPPAQDTSS